VAGCFVENDDAERGDGTGDRSCDESNVKASMEVTSYAGFSCAIGRCSVGSGFRERLCLRATTMMIIATRTTAAEMTPIAHASMAVPDELVDDLGASRLGTETKSTDPTDIVNVSESITV